MRERMLKDLILHRKMVLIYLPLMCAYMVYLGSTDAPVRIYTVFATLMMGMIPGPNGSGRTTIIKLVMNLVRKDAGLVRIFGKDHVLQEVDVKSRIGFVHDSPAFYGFLTLGRIKALVAPHYTEGPAAERPAPP